MRFEQAIQSFQGQPLSQQILMDILKDYRWPHNKLTELVDKGLLIRVKKGLYITGPQLELSRPLPFLIANHIYGPSYVSVEAALSYWDLIPEKVTTITSMTTGTTRSFRTKIGRYEYIHTKLPYYSFGIEIVSLSDQQSALIASKEKALCDKIITTKGVFLRSIAQTVNFLTEDLRIERQALLDFDISAIRSWVNDAPKKQSLLMLIKTLETL